MINGENAILGRLAARIAKKLLEGEEIHLINAEKLILSGDLSVAVEKYQARRRVQRKTNPEYSPHWPRVPNLLVRRIIRGMLPYKRRKSAREAYKRLRVYIGAPQELAEKAVSFPELDGRGLRKYSTVLELCKRLGYQ